MSTTAATLCIGALELLGVVDPEESPAPTMITKAFRRLNNMMGQWALQSLTIPVVAREVYPLLAGKGSPSNPYTYGVGGNLNAVRPIDLYGCGLLLNTNPNLPVEIPRGMLNDDSYEAIRIKDLTASLFTNVYYNATFPFGTVFLWPIPTDTTNSLVLYRLQQLGPFTSPTASYDLPEGAEEAVEYNLAKRLLDVYSVDAQRKINIIDIAKTSLGVYKRSNLKLVDQPMDLMFTPNNRTGGYDINVGGTVGSTT